LERVKRIELVKAPDWHQGLFYLCLNDDMKIRKETSMNILKMGGAVLVGFVLGSCFYHPFAVKAQSTTGRAPVLVVSVSPDGGTPLPADVQVVGFSCVGGGQKAQCYLAVR
jgi:hypothetical protein